MSAPVMPVEAWAAVSPEGCIRLRTIQPDSAGAQMIVTNWRDVWDEMQRAGWHVIRVRVVPEENASDV